MLCAALALLAACAPLSVRAASVASGYDVRSLLFQPHPFADRTGTKWRPNVQAAQQAQPQPQAPQSGVQAMPAAVQPMPAGKTAPPAAAPAPVPAAAKSVAVEQAATGGWSEKSARASSRGKPLGGILAEVSIGGLMHDEGPFSNSKEDGYDVHLELRFASPKFLEIIWSPEPHIGANINSEGDTSQVFAGLSYEWSIWKGLFAGISVGGAYHDGETDSHAADKKDLGCHLLFRESLTLGWAITEHHKVAAIFDHISNAKLCDYNEGLENLGVRYSYRF